MHSMTVRGRDGSNGSLSVCLLEQFICEHEPCEIEANDVAESGQLFL